MRCAALNTLTGNFDLTVNEKVLTVTQMMAKVDSTDDGVSVVAEVKDVEVQDYIFSTTAQVNSTDTLFGTKIDDLSLQVNQDSCITANAGFELDLDERAVRAMMTMTDLADLESYMQAQLDGEVLGGYYSVA